jgi:hypothetical protein
MQLLADNSHSSDTLVVWWWWSGFVGDSLKLRPNEGFGPCIEFVAISWAQIEAWQGTYGRNSNLTDGQGLFTPPIDPSAQPYWIIRTGQDGRPTISPQPSRIC